jgi:NADH-quinone oxidoreductase subunit F
VSTHLLFEGIDEPGLNTLEGYRRRGGYQMLPRALQMSRDEVLNELIESALRGRGGAGFSMGKKA